MSKFAAAMYSLAGLAALLSVALAALTAHALASIAPTGDQAVAWFREATAFQMSHALGLMIVTTVAERITGRAQRLMRAACYLLLAATVLFPAALYSVSFNGPVFFAPFGGVSAMAGWALFGVAAWMARQPAE